MKKIIIVCTQLEAGGAQRAAIRLAEYIRNRHIECENWFLYKKRDVFKDVPNMKIIYPGQIKSIRSFFVFLNNLRKILKKSNPDSVITFGHNANVIVQLFAFFLGIKNRIASHRNPRWGYMSSIHQIIDYLWAYLGIYQKITAVSDSTKQSFSNYPARIFNGIKVIENGMDFTPSTLKKEEARELFDLPQNVFLVGNIGRLSYQKNQKLLIKSISLLEDDTHLAIVGEGELRNKLIALTEKLEVSNRVHFLGEIEHYRVPMFLKTLDIFAMPSRFEGLSNALVEAMCSGIPIICSSIDSQKDVIKGESDMHSGILLPLGDPKEWSEAIEKLNKDDQLYTTLKRRAKSRSNYFTIERMGKNFIEVITQN